MKKYFLYAFFVFLAADLLVNAVNDSQWRFVTKPPLLLLLLGYFLSAVKTAGRQRSLVTGALLLSWMGDVWLLFENRDPLFFMLGLGSFLIAHLLYIFYFHQLRVKEQIRPNGWMLIPVVLYYGGLIFLLNPYLGDLKIPVRVYGLVISFMLMLALQMLYLKEKTAGRLMAAGAVLFVASDSLLAINKFYTALPQAGVLIMLTYGLAQYCIAEGAVRYHAATKQGA